MRMSIVKAFVWPFFTKNSNFTVRTFISRFLKMKSSYALFSVSVEGRQTNKENMFPKDNWSSLNVKLWILCVFGKK